MLIGTSFKIDREGNSDWVKITSEEAEDIKKISLSETNPPSYIRLEVLDDEGNWNLVKFYHRKTIIETTIHKFLFFRWENSKHFYTETRKDFLERCNKDAQSSKKEDGRKMRTLAGD